MADEAFLGRESLPEGVGEGVHGRDELSVARGGKLRFVICDGASGEENDGGLAAIHGLGFDRGICGLGCGLALVCRRTICVCSWPGYFRGVKGAP